MKRAVLLAVLLSTAAFVPAASAGAATKAPAGCLAAMKDMDAINTVFLTFVTTGASKYQAIISTAIAVDGTPTLELQVLTVETKANTETKAAGREIAPAETKLKKDEKACRAGR